MAVDLSQLLEAMDVKPAPADVLAMAAAARVERSPAGAVAVGARLRIIADAQAAAVRGAMRRQGLDEEAAGDEEEAEQEPASASFAAALTAEVLSADVGALGLEMVELCLDANDAAAADTILEVRRTEALMGTLIAQTAACSRARTLHGRLQLRHPAAVHAGLPCCFTPTTPGLRDGGLRGGAGPAAGAAQQGARRQAAAARGA